MKRLIFIDWISTPDHAGFNASFFHSLHLPDPEYYFFTSELRIKQCHNNIVYANRGRIGRLLEVIKICFANRDNAIFFLTYDQIFVPIIQLISKHIYVFEHNTTPQAYAFNKHAIWQKALYRRINRIAQFQGQMDILLKMGQPCFYLGSPLKAANLEQKSCEKTVFLAPSYRFDKDELRKILPYIKGEEIIAKRGALRKHEWENLRHDFNIKPVDYIDLPVLYHSLKGVIITVSSRVRGTYWFNEAIALGLPIIITNNNAKVLFEETFPGYPYVDVSAHPKPWEFEQQLERAWRFCSYSYISIYNQRFRDRFNTYMDRN